MTNGTAASASTVPDASSEASGTHTLAPETADLGITPDEFKAAFRNHPAGVALITADDGSGPVAMTATSVFSVSATPPLLVFSASELSSSTPTIARSETQVVHLLGAEQLDLAVLGSTSGIDRFADTSIWSRLPSGEPYFPAAHSWIRGRIINRLQAGGSTLFVLLAVEASPRRLTSTETRMPLHSSTTAARGTAWATDPASTSRAAEHPDRTATTRTATKGTIIPATNPPTDPAAQLQWLVDRAAIADLIANFGVSVDDKDQESYAANFTEDATLVLPFGAFTGRSTIATMKGPPAHWLTQHLIGDIVIDLDGDTAETRAYLLATHVFTPEDKTQKAHSGGWYKHTVVRTPDGWRFARVELVVIWEDARPMVPQGADLGVPA